MATYYKKLDNIPEERYYDIVVQPMVHCLKNRGILIDTLQNPIIETSIDDVTTIFFLMDGGSVDFWRTTVPTVNVIDNSVMDRTTLIKISGIRDDSNITDGQVNEAIKSFDHYLAENGFGMGRIQEGGSVQPTK